MMTGCEEYTIIDDDNGQVMDLDLILTQDDRILLRFAGFKLYLSPANAEYLGIHLLNMSLVVKNGSE